MEALQNILKMKALEGMRTYLAIAGLWLCSLAEWNGLDIEGFTAMSPVNTLIASVTILGLYEKIKAYLPK